MPETIEEDACAKWGLPTDPLKVHTAATYKPKSKYTKLIEQWRRMLNLGRLGTPKIGMMVEQILQREDYRKEFKRDFVLYVYYQKCEWRLFLHNIEAVSEC